MAKLVLAVLRPWSAAWCELSALGVLDSWTGSVTYLDTAAPEPYAEKLDARAVLGTLNNEGKLVTPRFGANVHVANLIRTDLPLAPDG